MNKHFFEKKWLLLLTLTIVMGAGCTSRQTQIERGLQQAYADVKAGKDDLAAIQYRQVIKKDPANIQAYAGLYQLAEYNGDLPEMLRNTQKLEELLPKDVSVKLRLGRLYALAGMPERSADILTQLQKKIGTTPDILTLQAMLQLEEKNMQAARTSASQAVAKDTKQAGAYAVLAKISQYESDYPTALKYADLGLACAKNDEFLRFLKLDILRSMGNSKQEIELATAIAKTHPTNFALNNFLVMQLTQDHLLDSAELILRNVTTALPYDVNHQITLIDWLTKNRSMSAAEQQARQDITQGHADAPVEFALAAILYNQQKYADAEKILQNIVAHASDDVDRLAAESKLAQIYMLQGKRDVAQQLVTKVLKDDPQQPDALMLRAGFYMNAKQYDSAIADLRVITTQKPDMFQAWLMLAQAYSMTTNSDLAIESLRKAYKVSNGAPQIAMVLQSYLLRMNKTAEAQSIVQDLSSQPLGDVSDLTMLAQMQMASKDDDAARETVNKIAALKDAGPIPALLTAQIELQTQQLAAAVNTLMLANKQFPADRRVAELLANALLASHDVVKAEQVINELLKQQADNGTAWLLQSQALWMNHDVPGVILALQNAIKAQPNVPIGYQRLGAVYLQTHQNQLAADTVQQGLVMNPNDINLLFLQAEIDDKNNLAQAIIDYEGILKMQPDNLNVVNNLVYDLDRKGDAVSKQRAWQYATALQGNNNPNYQDTYGWAAFQAGHMAEADHYLRAALQAMPDNIEIKQHLDVERNVQRGAVPH